MSSSEYSKMKNADLESLLKSRGLAHSGLKKAEMVAKLVEHDKTQKEQNPSAAAEEEDKIDWDDDTAPASVVPPAATTASSSKPLATGSADTAKADAKAATSKPAAAAIAAGGAGTRVANPQAVPNQAAAVDPASTAELKATKDGPAPAQTEASAGSSAEEKPKADFSSGLATTSLDEELEKRKKRAAKFGMSTGDSDAIKALERAKRFGAGDAAVADKNAAASAQPPQGVKGLDEALPERKRRGNKRGAGAVDGAAEDGKRESPAPPQSTSFEDPGLIKRGRGGKFGGRRGARRPQGGRSGGQASGGASWMNDDDRKKAEARKAKFG